MMADVKAKLNKMKGRGKVNPTRERKTGSKPITRAKKKPAEKSELDRVYESIDLSGPDDDEVDGIQKLLTSINRVAAKRADNIAKKLALQAEKGNVSSAKLMVDLGSRRQLNKASAICLLEVADTLESDRN